LGNIQWDLWYHLKYAYPCLLYSSKQKTKYELQQSLKKKEAELMSVNANNTVLLGIWIRVLGVGSTVQWRIARAYDIDTIQTDRVPLENLFIILLARLLYFKIRN
jgi:hypothetical protein